MADIRIAGVTKYYENGVLAVDGVDLDVEDGELLVLVGPSGCGKSTLLRMVAGLEEVTGGEIHIGGRDVTHLQPRHRDIAMVFQSYALYPHMTVRRNIGYPLRLAKVPGSEIDRRVAEVAAVLQLDAVLDRRPAHLSGGQRQRVAMGRAIIRQPKAFLMDEPLSNLDAKLRVEMRAEIARLQRDLGITTVYVTHDQVEAMTMGTRVAVLRDGRLQQIDTPQRLYDAPVNLFVATFIGSPAMNLFDGQIVDGSVRIGSNRLTVDHPLPPRGAVLVGIRPEGFVDAALEPGLPGERCVEATVDLVESLGSELLVHVTVAEKRAIARLSVRSRLRPGDVVKLAVDTDSVHFFDPETGDTVSERSERVRPGERAPASRTAMESPRASERQRAARRWGPGAQPPSRTAMGRGGAAPEETL